MRQFMIGLLLALLLMPSFAGVSRAADHVTFGLDWLAEAEYGGYYQALATGIYQQHGLDVTIREGGPQVNQMQLMMAGRLDFNLGGGRAIEFVQQHLPFVAIAAIFQKDPAVLIAHPGQGDDSFAALKGKPIEIGADTRSGWWRFLAAKYGYSDSQIRPYTFNLAPFLADKQLIQQGYLGSEPYPDRTEGRLRSRGAAGRRWRLCRLCQHHHHKRASWCGKARTGATLHRCLDRGLVFVPVPRPGTGQPG